MIDVVDRTANTKYSTEIIYDIKKKLTVLPDLLYTHKKDEYKRFEKKWKKVILKEYQEKQSKLKYGEPNEQTN